MVLPLTEAAHQEREDSTVTDPVEVKATVPTPPCGWKVMSEAVTFTVSRIS